ncbi:MAG: SRPBCC family protein [Nocardioidaceae bacterium]|nr:SRPBCC family protein [Nocardioidaceae bacterium]
MVAHTVIRQEVAATVEDTFDLIHDYPRRLEWDTMLRRAFTVGDVPPGPGVEAVCSARWRFGGLTFRTRYVTFRRPDLAAVSLVDQPPLFAGWAASIRHRTLSSTRSEVVYTLTFSCRPASAARVVEPVALAAFSRETQRRLRALAEFLEAPGKASGSPHV